MRNIAHPDRTQGHSVIISAVPLGAGRFEAWCDGEVVVGCTPEPLLAGARALLAAGYDPDTIATMRHAGSDVDALSARIGMAARFCVEESAHGPILRSVRKASPSAVDRPPIAQTRPDLIRAPPNDDERPAISGGSASGIATPKRGTPRRSPSSSRPPPTRRASPETQRPRDDTPNASSA